MVELENCSISRRVKSNHHLENIGSLFKELYSKNNLTDITISCNDGSINAHKLVLSAYSSYFNRLLNKTNSNVQTVFIMHKVTLKNMKYLLEFMYNGTVEIPEHTATELITLAKDLEIKGFDLLEGDIIENKRSTIISKRRNTDQSNIVQTQRQNKANERIQARNTNRLSIESNETDAQSVSTFNTYTTDDSENTERRNTRFKGKKRVPVGEVEEPDDIVQSNSKRKNSRVSSVDGSNSFVIKEISGSDGSVLFNAGNKKSISTTQSTQERSSRDDITCEKVPVSVESASGSVRKAVLNQQPEAVTIAVTPEITVADGRSRRDDVEIRVVENSQSETLKDPDTTNKTRKNNDENETKKEFRCIHCNQRFLRQSHLIKHKRVHKGERLYACKRCDRRFSRLDKLRLHIRNKHDDMCDFVPKTGVSKKLYGNQIETSPIQLRRLEQSAGENSSVTQSIIQSIKEISSDESKTKQMKSMEKRGRGRPRIKDKSSENKSISHGTEHLKPPLSLKDDIKIFSQPIVKIPRENLMFSAVLVRESKNLNENSAGNEMSNDSSILDVGFDPIGIEYTDRIVISDSEEVNSLEADSSIKQNQSTTESVNWQSLSGTSDTINANSNFPGRKPRGRPRVRPITVKKEKKRRGKPPGIYKTKHLDVKKEKKKPGRPRIHPVKLKTEKKPRGRVPKEKKPSNQEKKARGRPKKMNFPPVLENENNIKSQQENYDLATLPYGDFSYLTSELASHFSGESNIIYPTSSVPVENMVTSTPCQTTAVIPYNSDSLTITQINNDIKQEIFAEPPHLVPEVPDITTQPSVVVMDNVRVFGECTIRPVT